MSAEMSKKFTVPLMRGCVVWIQFNGSFVFSFGAGEIVIVVVENASERGMRLGQSVVERQGFQRGLPRFRQGFTGRQTAIDWKQCVSIGETGMGQRIIRVERDGLVEILNRLLNILWRALVPIETSFQIKLISLRIVRVVLRQLLLVRARQSYFKFVSNVAGDVVLQRDEVRHRFVVGLFPQNILRRRVNQLDIQN